MQHCRRRHTTRRAAELDQLQAGPDQPFGQAQAGRVVVTPGGAEGEVSLLQIDQIGVLGLGDDPNGAPATMPAGSHRSASACLAASAMFGSA